MKRDKELKWSKQVVRVNIYLTGRIKDEFHKELVKGYTETELGLLILRKHFK